MMPKWTRACIKVDYGSLQISDSQNVDHRCVAGCIDPAGESYLGHAAQPVEWLTWIRRGTRCANDIG